MNISIDALAQVVALVACAALLIVWLTAGRRKPISFYYTCTGWAAIIACVRSDHSPAQLVGILIATALVSGGLLTVYGMFKARRAAHKLACGRLEVMASRRGRKA